MLANTEQPFTLSVAEGDIALLHKKLDLARFPGGLEEADWDYGAALADVKRLAEHWRWTFDWRKAEGEINKLPMFTRDITVDGFGSLNIHYIHQKSEVGHAIPLLFVHGWPGHFLEVRKMLPLLTARSPEHPSFHVVALSLPGFGFSEAPKMPGFAGRYYAEVFNKLMCSLGYDEYVYQGGDWGHVLGLHAVTHDRGKHSIKAWHTNTPVARPPALLSHPLLFLDMLTIPFKTTVQADVEHNKKLLKTGFGYLSIQSTKPHTLGFSLADSPVGLLAWIYEKLVSWSDNYPWTDDEVIEWVSIYWFSRAGPDAAQRIYYEMTSGGTHDVFEGAKWTDVPLGVSYFPQEIVRLPRSWSHMLGHLVFESVHGYGGHFAAFERPEELASDLRVMFGNGGLAHGVASGKRGYD
ncbi:alpha/beta-hydrolase [Trametes coccinea BRFM310]|uniref:Alpha/beta-hydrolase n=1 Tax=Trametes coccinea (strain BRFM310) TaxID=1353009 RepID=A0A1Y2IWM1_TRAC3|nr:alpha/beta-hydrolase [Trametes coccinea BRFM310]